MKKYEDGNSYKIEGDVLVAFQLAEGNVKAVIPDGVIIIGGQACQCCSELTTIEIPEGVEHIGDYAFSNSSKLTSVVIPDSVKSIGDNAFSGCQKLTSIVIPNSVRSIGKEAFSWCGLTFIEIPSGVTSIGSCAFGACERLISVIIPVGVMSIGDCAFQWCQNLAYIRFPDNVTSIGKKIFEGCSKLTTMVMPKGDYRDKFLRLHHMEHSTAIITGDAMVAVPDMFKDLMEEKTLSLAESSSNRSIFRVKLRSSDKLLLEAAEAYACLERAQCIEASEDTFIVSKIEISYEACELALRKNAEPQDGGAKAKKVKNDLQTAFVRAYANKNGVKEGESIVEGLSKHFQNQVCRVLSQCDMEDSVMELCGRAAELGEERKLAYLCAGDVSSMYQGDEDTKNAVEHNVVESIYSKLVIPGSDVVAEDIFDNGEDELWKLLDGGLVNLLSNVKPDGQIVVCKLLDDIAKCQKDMGLPSQCILAPFLRDDMPTWVKDRVKGVRITANVSMAAASMFLDLESNGGGGAADKRDDSADKDGSPSSKRRRLK